ncbi:hypothetical protein PAAG_11565 [Paracoccidioides lutzii Pb01]|uniref:Uncharacterized protein n=1 Tax=Paracoccidioides lutzii (strain ATCC MYA-826 / Pb01) TaxID=502779 RepID=A0A0A2V5X1_PARBA|nr:hypothetical protein PAAG_11565 [Paracoccidioides lutzii Pb01]KGQ01717.1 hypothetical protein PAAG_11565 [Paracoccidioides lutzii Pb01]
MHPLLDPFLYDSMRVCQIIRNTGPEETPRPTNLSITDNSIQPTLNATSHPDLVKDDKRSRAISIGYDQLELDPQQLEAATEKCREYWYCLAAMAISRCREGLPPASTNPRNMLNRIPAIRTGLGNIISSTWRITEAANCGVAEKVREVQGLLQIGSQAPIPCIFGGESFRQWIGSSDEARGAPIYLGILAIGWSYILSAHLVEMRGEGAEMSCTNSRVTAYLQEAERVNAPLFIVDLGELDEEEARWWAAILAPSEGWRAIVSQRKMESIWLPGNSLIHHPPSSRKAFEYLARFSSRHNLGSQFLVGLTTAMTFPTHNYHGTVVQLPLPAESTGQQKNTSLKSSTPDWATVSDQLSYYITLSCSLEVVISILCGMFWESDVTCNMVSPWLHPILREVPEGQGIARTPGLYHEILAIMCSFRRPQVFTLWLGAVASGLTPTILCQVARGRPPLDANAFPWTGCPQSFMDVPGSGSYICEGSTDKVRRADVWRLLHLPPVTEDDLHYESRPFTPWAPIGDTTVRNCVSRVIVHLNCSRHNFGYQHWNWTLEDGTVIEDQGYESTAGDSFPEESNLNMDMIADLVFHQKSLDQEASREASLDIFRWVTVNGEGTPPEKVYRDAWVQFEDDSDEETDASNDDNIVCYERGGGVGEWLDRII